MAEQDNHIDEVSVDEMRDQVKAAFADEFVFEEEDGSFSHPPSGHRFRYIPGGRFWMGYSKTEERAAEAIFTPVPATATEMRPLRLITVSPFLLAERPVLNREIGGEFDDEYRNSAAYVDFATAHSFAETFGMTIQSEVQWEYSCRAGSSTLFTWGDAVPSDDELAAWLVFNFENGNGKRNAFGLRGIFIGEWTSDPWTESYEENQVVDPDVKVIRGGGAYFWPWQDQEWVWCMSAMRMPSTDTVEGECGFRLARNFHTTPYIVNQ
jgi:formylglycine-generating enzyme required for sulfatase activity